MLLIIILINLLSIVILPIWAFFSMSMLISYVSLPNLSREKTINKEPLVTVIIPTRNEEDKIKKCLQSLKMQTYKNFEAIIVDDSTDKTVEVIKKLTKDDKRFRLIKQGEKPAGWIGKSYALQKGSKMGRGKWFLFVDADVELDPDAIWRSISYAERNSIDMLTLIPHLVCKSFWEKVVQPIIGGLILFILPPFLVNNSKSKIAFAAGPFILIRKGIFEEIGGYEKIKDKITDDVELARLVKRSGYKLRISMGQDLVKVRMYRNFREIWSGFGKNIFLGLSYLYDIKTKPMYLGIAIGGTLGIIIFITFPFFLFLISAVLLMIDENTLSTFLLSLIVWLFSLLSQVILRKLYRGYIPYTLLSFLGGIITAAIFFNSAMRVLLGKGVEWKGEIYYKE